MNNCRLLEEETTRLLEWCRETLSSQAQDIFGASAIARRLGAHPNHHGVTFGFWIPGSSGSSRVPFLEIFTPREPVDFLLPSQTVPFDRASIPLQGVGDFWWAVVEGPHAGNADRSGSYYWVRRHGGDGVVHDCLAYSLPFGSFAPAEIYDVERVQAERRDSAYFRQLADAAARGGAGETPRIAPPVNILEIHLDTATSAGTAASLTRAIEGIATRIADQDYLRPSEQLLCHYDAFELLPLEPVAEPRHPPCWRPSKGAAGGQTVAIELRRPEISNWGYDALIAGFPAFSPTLLASGRPDEMVELASALHSFPGGPVKLIFDVVLGHAHRQAEPLLAPDFFWGPNRYGLSLSYLHPVVRAVLLEMFRRKLNWGADGVRVDASQDILVCDLDTGELVQDDDFLELMGKTEAEAAGVRYRPFMIFEDGRPWPRSDWKLTASFREVTRRQPEALQWSPLTFSSNEPLQPTFWIDRKWRLDEIARHGSHWVTGISNHDTLRHATHLNPALAANWESPRDAFLKTFNNPAANLLFTGFLPGVPMDFLNAAREAPWTFLRNADDYRLKTVCGELGALSWTVDWAAFTTPANFRRLKGLGFDRLRTLRRFTAALRRSARLADFEPKTILQHLRLAQGQFPVPATFGELNDFCDAWMEDWRDYCRQEAADFEPDPGKAYFHARLRQFRLANPWLRNNLAEGDRFERLDQFPPSVVYRGFRRSPDRALEILLLVNLAGEPASLEPPEIPIEEEGWTAELETPELAHRGPESTTLDARQGLLFHRLPNRT